VNYVAFAHLRVQGGGFIGYGIIMATMFVVGEGWVRRHGHAPELYDSAVITIWVRSSFGARRMCADNRCRIRELVTFS
jgi:hypothetical protein